MIDNQPLAYELDYQRALQFVRDHQKELIAMNDQTAYQRGWQAKADADRALIAELAAKLGLVLDQVDYTEGACALTEMVGACLPVDVITQARAALAAAEQHTTKGE